MATETGADRPLSETLGGLPRAAVEPPRAAHGKLATFFIRLYRATLDDQIDNIGAMLAYYAVLALFPMIVFVVMLGLLVLPGTVIDQGLSMAMAAVPASARSLIFERVQSLVQHANTGVAILSMIVALWGASRGAVAMMLALNSLYQKKELRPWWRRQLIALAVTIGVALLVIVALGLLVAGPIIGHWVADRLGLGSFDLLWSIVRWAGAGILVMIVWAIVYKFLPNTNAPFRIFTPGAFVGVLLWLLVSYGFGVYLSHFNSYEVTYGALGTAIIFLTWLWLSNIAILFGAEINDVLADLRRDRSEAARQLSDVHEDAR